MGADQAGLGYASFGGGPFSIWVASVSSAPIRVVVWSSAGGADVGIRVVGDSTGGGGGGWLSRVVVSCSAEGGGICVGIRVVGDSAGIGAGGTDVGAGGALDGGAEVGAGGALDGGTEFGAGGPLDGGADEGTGAPEVGAGGAANGDGGAGSPRRVGCGPPGQPGWGGGAR